TVEIHAEAGGRDDHRRRYAGAVGEDHAVGFDRLHGVDDLDAAATHSVDELKEDVRRKSRDGPPHEMRRCADGKPDPACAGVGELDGDVGGRIAGADNEDVAVAERPSVSEVAGVNEVAGEPTQAWPGRDGGRAVVARGEDDRPRSDFA